MISVGSRGLAKLAVMASIAFLLSHCSFLPEVVWHHDGSSSGDKTAIYLANHGWHTGLVIPAERIQSSMPDLRDRFGAVPYLEFGWGDEGFYQANEVTTGLTLRALFWSSGSVLHIAAVPSNVAAHFPGSEVMELCLTDSELRSLIEFVVSSFSKTPQGTVSRLKKGLYGDSQFYGGVGTYQVFNTCNKWTAKALASGGMDISPAFKLTASSVMRAAKGQRQLCPANTKRTFNDSGTIATAVAR